MPAESTAAPWNAKQAAVMAELSEAPAYCALARTAAAEGSLTSVQITPLADGIALRCVGDLQSTLFNRVLGQGLDRPFDASTAATVQARFAGCEGRWGIEIAPVAANDGVRVLLK